MKMIKVFHLLIGLSAQIIVLVPQQWLYFDNAGFCPYNTILTALQERIIASSIVFICGLCMTLTARKFSENNLSFYQPLASSLLLAAVCFGFYLRYFSGCSALYAVLCLLDAFLISCLWIKRSGSCLLSVMSAAFTTTLLFFCTFICSFYYLFRWGVS